MSPDPHAQTQISPVAPLLPRPPVPRPSLLLPCLLFFLLSLSSLMRRLSTLTDRVRSSLMPRRPPRLLPAHRPGPRLHHPDPKRSPPRPPSPRPRPPSRRPHPPLYPVNPLPVSAASHQRSGRALVRYNLRREIRDNLEATKEVKQSPCPPRSHPRSPCHGETRFRCHGETRFSSREPVPSLSSPREPRSPMVRPFTAKALPRY